ncbi:MAG: flagellar protein [Herbinix sp.]|jgi:hypothetical protein|nr:flagellar protein [Herbinix sp.]
MEVKVCKNCRRLFKYIYGPELCQDCAGMMTGITSEAPKAEKKSIMKPLVLEEEKKLDQVKEYIVVHPRATVAQIAEANEVSANRLLDWVREDRLEFSDDSEHAWFQCIKCGVKIKSGMYCFRCRPNK